MKKVQEILDILEAHAPRATAESWDNVGLLVGDADSKITSALACIDLSVAAIEKARALKAKVVIHHHPCVFGSKGLSKVTQRNSPAVIAAIKNGISVIACHTNFDRSALEVVDQVAHGLKLNPIGRLHDETKLYKLVTFVPETHLAKVRDALCEAGAGQIGRYDRCTFSQPGMGTFRALPGTQPFVGKLGRLEQISEMRLETLVPEGLEAGVLKALRASHPYEEIAYDLYRLAQSPYSAGLVRGMGYGFYGEFSRPKSFSEVAQSVRSLFRVRGFWLSEPRPRQVKRVGFIAGKGASFIDSAAALNCDLLITGEVGYHNVLAAKRKSLAVLELGHQESEKFFAPTIKNWLRKFGVNCAIHTEPNQRVWP